MVAGEFPESIMKKVDKCIPKSRCVVPNDYAKEEK